MPDRASHRLDPRAPVLEICVDNLAGVQAAIAGGADRIELCSALALGGLTPSAAFAAEAVKAGVPIHAMVRPRVGGFDYDDDEIALIVDDIRRLASLGVAGVVVGATDSVGRLKERALANFRDAASEIAIVLHRAVDLTPDPAQAVSTAANLGYDAVLTSGGALTAFEGRATIADMAAAANGRLQVMAGSGVSADNVAALVASTGVRQIHGSASEAQAWPDPRLEQFGFAPGQRRVTDPARVAALKQALKEAI